MSAAKQREVVQLLRYYRDWHTAYGGAGVPNLESLGEYGPAGMIVMGIAFKDEACLYLLRESYEHLEHALTLLKRDHFEAWILLKGPYTGDPGDPRIIDEWREKPGTLSVAAWRARGKELREKISKGELEPGCEELTAWRKQYPGLIAWHEFAIEKLAGYLRFRDLYVPWASKKQTRKPATIKEMNDAFIEDYEKLRIDGLSKRKAIQTAAEWNDYSEQRGYEIVRVREGGEKRERKRA